MSQYSTYNIVSNFFRKLKSLFPQNFRILFVRYAQRPDKSAAFRALCAAIKFNKLNLCPTANRYPPCREGARICQTKAYPAARLYKEPKRVRPRRLMVERHIVRPRVILALGLRDFAYPHRKNSPAQGRCEAAGAVVTKAARPTERSGVSEIIADESEPSAGASKSARKKKSKFSETAAGGLRCRSSPAFFGSAP